MTKKHAKEKKPRKRSGPKGRSNKYPVETLHAEYLAGDFQSLTEFMASKNIPEGTHRKWTKGWAEERMAFQQRAAQLAIKKLGEKRARLIARNLEAGEALINCGMVALRDAKLKPETAGEAAHIAKSGADIVGKVLQLEQDAEKDGQIGVAVEVQTAGVDGESLRVIAKAIARTNAGVRTNEPPALEFKECGAG